MRQLTMTEVFELGEKMLERESLHSKSIYGVPRGGISVALVLKTLNPTIRVVDEPSKADCIVDDLEDSGATRKRFAEAYPEKPFMTLVEKNGQWIEFPWERSEGPIDDNISRIIQYIGENPEREGLIETPARVRKAWEQWCSGYGKNAGDILKVFEDGAENVDSMVVVKDIPLYSKCEHHMADIFGTATIAYIPNGKIVGLSKLSRLLDMYARRLQVQERLTNQVADALQEHLNPIGVGVLIKARHMCMESRGICQQGHYTITSALRGAMRDKSETRAEFMGIAK